MSTEAIDVACVALRNFVHVSGALRAQALIPLGSGEPAIVSCVRLGPLEIAIGERSVELPHDVAIEADAPDLGGLRPRPPGPGAAQGRGGARGVGGGARARPG